MVTKAREFVASLVRDAVDSVRAWSWLKRLVILAGLVLFIGCTVFLDVPPLGVLRSWADQLGSSFVVVFWLLYVLITQFPIPRTVLTLASGVLFGPLWGSVIALTATTASAMVSLALVRRLLGDWMAPRLKHPAVASINARLRQRGWLAVGSLRLIAGVPFSILNYVAALTAVRVVPFGLATLVGSAPGTCATVLIGDTLTTGFNPLLAAITVGLAALGCLGLLIDAKAPVRTSI